MDIKEKINTLPAGCGVYIIKDASGNIIYIGKSTSIKARLKSHFKQPPKSVKQQAIINSASSIDYILTSSAEAALLLEAALIRKCSPKYNAALKDDKSYPSLKLTINEDFPRLLITRRKKDDGALYFGPYTNAKLLKAALKFISRLFPLRSCQKLPKKPCLDFHIGQCLAPCIDKISKDEYKRIVKNVILFLEGETDKLCESLFKDMEQASGESNFELAGKIRDQIEAVSSIGKRPGSRYFSHFSTQLEDLRMALGLAKAPEVIEAFDISNIAGKEAVGSLVVFKNAKASKADYRRFQIKTVRGINDYSMMKEIVKRRYSRWVGQAGKLPDLIIIDGGRGHLLSAKKQLQALGISNVPVIGIAKNFELIYTQENKKPLDLDPASAASLLIQRIRDEAHRFAINYHRALRSKKVAVSELDAISGIGPVKKRMLLRHFASVDEVKMADIDDLTGVKLINEKLARKIYDYFNKDKA